VSDAGRDPLDALARDRVLVTGASGFIGAALVRRLAGAGIAVAGLYRGAQPRGAPGEALRAGLDDAQALARAVAGFAPTLCYHLAAHPDAAESLDHSTAVLRTNVLGTLNLLEALRVQGGVRLVYGCSVKVYGNGPVPYRADQAPAPNSSYAVSKSAARDMVELYRQLHGLASVTLRPTLVYGPGQGPNLLRFVASKLREGAADIPLMSGSQTRAPVYLDDAVEAFLRAGAALEAGGAADGAVLPIGGPEELAVIDLVRRMAQVAGRPLTPVLVESDVRPTEIFRSAADNSAAAETIGWAPATPLDEGLRLTLEAEGVALPDAPAPGAARSP
jgi:nucleoside-diphosphate-sugar epimerase